MDINILPVPKKIDCGEGYFTLRGVVYSEFDNDYVEEEVKKLFNEFLCIDLNIGNDRYESDFVIIRDETMDEQAYSLAVLQKSVEIKSNDDVGAFYGLQTLKQLVVQFGTELPVLQLSDKPDLKERGVLIDISRDKIPTMDTLIKMIDLFAMLKINHLQLYIEGYPFAYESYPHIWEKETPITPDELRQIDIYCKSKFIELVANQNCLGHMQPWLVNDEFNHLSECPDGFIFARGERVPPATIDPTNDSAIEFVENLMDDLLPNFSSDKFNVNLDEPFELGRGASKDIVEKHGLGQLYLDYICKIHKSVSKRGKKMMMWGDVISKHPDIMKNLSKDISIIEWGYESDHPFDDKCRQLSQHGVDFYLAPGTSSWRSLGGRTHNMKQNILNCVYHAKKYGAKGVINTDWGDEGHWQYLPISYNGISFGAAQSWNNSIDQESHVKIFLNNMIFKDDAHLMAQTLWALGEYVQFEEFTFPGQTQTCAVLFRGLSFKHVIDAIRSGKFEVNSALGNRTCSDFINGTSYNIKGLQALTDSLLCNLDIAAPRCEDGSVVIDEVRNSIRTILHGANLINYFDQMVDLNNQQKKEALKSFIEELKVVIEEHERLWLIRNRFGGFERSVARFNRLLNEYEIAMRNM